MTRLSTWGDSVDAEGHGAAGTIQVIVEGEVQTARGRDIQRAYDLSRGSRDGLGGFQQHVGTS